MKKSKVSSSNLSFERDSEYRQSNKAIVVGSRSSTAASNAASTASPVVPQWKVGEDSGKAELQELLSETLKDKSGRSFGM